jgi:hypothetical protein
MTMSLNKPQGGCFVTSLLLATIGSIAYLRAFFDESSFNAREYTVESPTKDDTRHRVGRFTTIKRNASFEANTLLDYLVPLLFD